MINRPLLGPLQSVAIHPWAPFLVCGDKGGTLYFLDLIGIEYGAIVVTAVDRGNGSVVRCPKCWQAHPLKDDWLGRVIDCPTPTCGLSLRVNPFIVGHNGGRI